VPGLDEGTVLTATEMANPVAVSFDTAIDPERLVVAVDGTEVEATVAEDGLGATVNLGRLADGDHELSVQLLRPFPLGATTVGRSFSVDTVAPVVALVAPSSPVSATEPLTVELSLDDPAADVTIDGVPAEVVDGMVEVIFDRPPRAPIEVRAVDVPGNEAVVSLPIPLALAGEPGQEPIRGVHASGWTWATPELREPILDLIKEGKINTVEIDIKDESGDIWYDTEVDLAHEIGAVTELWDLGQVVEELHELNARVIVRIVNFRDPRLADWAAANGRMEMVVQNPDGTAYGKYGGYTNPFDADVWEYNIAIAEEAAGLGVDDVLYDYVRRPDDYVENLVYPDQTGTPEEAIVDFLASSRERIHAAGSRLGASVFGIAATRPDEVAQDIPAMAEHVDYIAPMVYPSHWGPGEYGVTDPNSQPYDIVYRSMVDFSEQLSGSGASLVVWLQDFSLGVDYGPAEVRAQIDAALDAGVDDFLLWDAATTYTEAALD
jgi:hypothetical protein